MCPNAFLSELGGDIAHAAFERRFDRPHEVVMLDNTLRTIEGHGEETTAVLHQRLSQAGHPDERMAGDVHRDVEAGDGAIRDPAMQILARREGDRMQQKVEATPFRSDPLEYGLELTIDLYVARHYDLASKPVGDRTHEGFGLGVQISCCQPGASVHEGFGATGSYAVPVGDPNDEPPLAAEIEERSGRSRSLDVCNRGHFHAAVFTGCCTGAQAGPPLALPID
jgi:hypothetical protein